MSLKKKGVSSLVQKWQKVKKEVEQEERANEQRQLAIRQQLEEWKKENRYCTQGGFAQDGCLAGLGGSVLLAWVGVTVLWPGCVCHCLGGLEG